MNVNYQRDGAQTLSTKRKACHDKCQVLKQQQTPTFAAFARVVDLCALQALYLLYRIVYIDELVLQCESLCQMFAQGFDAAALRRVMASGEIVNTGLVCDVDGLF